MSGDTFGRVFRLTTFGESHGVALGGVVEGCPAGVPLTNEIIQAELDRRKPGQGVASTARKESDGIQLLSGVFEGKTTGTAIGFVIYNADHRSNDYDNIKDVFRPGHADYTYHAKHGIRDYRGGGRASGRETVSRVAGGAIAQELLKQTGIQVRAYPVELGGIEAAVMDPEGAQNRPFFAPDEGVLPLWEEKVLKTKEEGDSLGGIVQVEALGVPAGLGEPVFDKLDGLMAHALMSVGAVKAVEVGSGIQAARRKGSENNDPLGPDGFHSNNAGGILGGISSGQTIVLRAAVKPIASIGQEQQTVNLANEPTLIQVSGRHDISAIPRIVPVLKAMTMLVLADCLLLQRRMG